MNSLTIKDLRVSTEDTEIIKGLSLEIATGEVHALMGPNGSGKSSLAYGLMGHPNYKIDAGSCVLLNGEDLSGLDPHERAQKGLFLAFQSPISIPGVRVNNFLRTAFQAIHGRDTLTVGQCNDKLKEAARMIGLKEDFLSRSINEGFSGGERKKMEMVQALVLEPQFLVFDEIDTGLDVDALKVVSKGVRRLVEAGAGVLMITHYQRILSYVQPDYVHILKAGRIVESGDKSLAARIEENGYEEMGEGEEVESS